MRSIGMICLRRQRKHPGGVANLVPPVGAKIKPCLAFSRADAPGSDTGRGPMSQTEYDRVPRACSSIGSGGRTVIKYLCVILMKY
jgi:hypothetical protein